MARIQKHVYVAFEVRGNLQPEISNPVLHKFYHLLNNFRIEKEGFKIVVNSKDPAVFETIDSSWAKGSIHLDMEVIGYREEARGVIYGLDHDTESLILNELAKLRVEEGKYTKKVLIAVTDVSFSQSYKNYPLAWPKEEMSLVGF